MKKTTTLLLVALIGLLILSGCKKSFEKCTITGKVVGRNSTSLLMLNALDDIRFAKVHIPIIDSSFTYEFDANSQVAYWLIFEDEFSSPEGLFPITIFPDKEKIDLTLYDSKRIKQNKIIGGKLNEQFSSYTVLSKSTFDPLTKPFYDRRATLRKNDNYHSALYKELSNELDKATTQDERIIIYKRMDDLGDNAYTEPVKEINLHLDSIFKDKFIWTYNYYDENLTLVSYYLLLRELMNKEKYSDLSQIKSLIEKLNSKYPDHPYKKNADALIGSWDKITVGGRLIDFVLPDLEGNKVTLSQVIEGKYALIDLWATWCGPCIATSRSMIPVYDEFKNSGFTILGVAAEIDNTDALKKTLDREKFPWKNLIDLNNQNGIWNKYGVSNSGGGTFLVGPDGTILAIKPSADEVRKILTERINK